MTGDITGLVFLLVKALVVFGLGLYIIFAFVILRQEQLMAHVLEETFEPVLRLMSVLHFIASVSVFLLAIILL
jgi:hypothetical protein